MPKIFLGASLHGAKMDILSLTRNTPDGVKNLNRAQLPVKPTRTSRALAKSTEAATSGSKTAKTQSKTEATRTRQKSPENLLDLLSGLSKGSRAEGLTLSINDPNVKLALQKTTLPPSPSDLLSALSALGIQVPLAAQGQIGAPETLIQGIQASELPQPVKDLLGSLLKEAMATPLPASSLIDMERPVPFAPKTPKTLLDGAVRPRPLPAMPHASLKPIGGFESDIAPVPASGQTLDGKMVAELNVTAINSGDLRASAAVRIVPNPKLDPEPKPVVIVPRPTLGGNEEVNNSGQPAPIAKGRPVPQAGAPPEGPRLGIVPRRSAENGAKAVPRPSMGPRPQPSMHLAHPVMGMAEPLQSVSTGLSGEAAPMTSSTYEVPVPRPLGGELNLSASSLKASEAALVEAITTSNILDVDDSLSDPSIGRTEPVPSSILPDPAIGPKPAADRAPMPAERAEKVVNQVADRIETMVFAKKSGSVTVQLNPVDLGTITLTVKTFGNKVDAEIRASDDHVRAALEANRQTLVQNVENRGLTMNSFNVGQDANQNTQHQGHQAAQAESDRNANLRHSMNQRPTSEAVAPRPFLSTTSAVDYLI